MQAIKLRGPAAPPPPSAAPAGSAFSLRWVYALAAIPPLLMLLAISREGVNVPFQDEWELVPYLARWRAGTLPFLDLAAQHNEHRIFFSRLIMLTLSGFTHWDLRAELYISFVLCVAILAGLCFLLRLGALGPIQRPLATLAVALLFFSSVQWANWEMGWEIERYFCVLAVVVCLWALTSRSNAWSGLAIGVAAAISASYSFGEGLIIWPAGLAAIVAGWRNRRLPAAVLWLAAAAATLWSYSLNYQKPGNTPEPLFWLHHPLQSLVWVFAYLGTAASATVNFAGNVPGISLDSGAYTISLFGGAILLGAAGVLLFALSIGGLVRGWPARRESWLPGVLLGSFALGDALVTAGGRAGFGLPAALESRYATVALLLWIGLVVPATQTIASLWSGAGRWQVARRAGSVATLAVCILLYWTSNRFSLAQLHQRSQQLQSTIPLLAQIDTLPPDQLRNLAFLYPRLDTLEQRTAQLRAWGYGPFRAS